MSEIFSLIAGIRKQLDMKDSEARLVEQITPFIRLTIWKTGKKMDKNPKQAETEADRPEKASGALKHRCFHPSISADLIKDIVSHYKL